MNLLNLCRKFDCSNIHFSLNLDYKIWCGSRESNSGHNLGKAVNKLRVCCFSEIINNSHVSCVCVPHGRSYKKKAIFRVKNNSSNILIKITLMYYSTKVHRFHVLWYYSTENNIIVPKYIGFMYYGTKVHGLGCIYE